MYNQTTQNIQNLKKEIYVIQKRQDILDVFKHNKDLCTPQSKLQMLQFLKTKINWIPGSVPENLQQFETNLQFFNNFLSDFDFDEYMFTNIDCKLFEPQVIRQNGLIQLYGKFVNVDEQTNFKVFLKLYAKGTVIQGATDWYQYAANSKMNLGGQEYRLKSSFASPDEKGYMYVQYILNLQKGVYSYNYQPNFGGTFHDIGWQFSIKGQVIQSQYLQTYTGTNYFELIVQDYNQKDKYISFDKTFFRNKKDTLKVKLDYKYVNDDNLKLVIKINDDVVVSQDLQSTNQFNSVIHNINVSQIQNVKLKVIVLNDVNYDGYITFKNVQVKTV